MGLLRGMMLTVSRSSDAWDTLGEVLGLFGDPGSTPEALFRRLADAALAVTGGHRAVLAQRERSGELEIRVARDDGGRDLDPRVLKVSRSVLESVLSSGESVFAPDVSAASVWADVQTVQELGTALSGTQFDRTHGR